ncbi:MAG: extracellular solute-binding protein, partial [Clostridia bacterium]|nr:extracellular solute-binding protein [Clostridia bacterium]
MKKVLALVLALAMFLSLASFASAEGFSGEVKIWVAEATVDFTKEQVEAFKAAHPEYANMTVVVEPVGEGDAASKMITDVEAGADIFGFAQDQLARLVAAGALEEVEPGNAEAVKAENDAGSVGAVTLGGTMYAYPMTSDNGYFLYYDKSVVTDPTSLEKILADCEAAGKSFYFEINSGWYQTAFFFGAGCELTFDSNDEGQLVAMNSTYASDNGVKALKSMIKLAKSPAFANGSSVSNATNLCAIVDGTWDAGAAKDVLGDNYAATKLPTVDGYQLGGFGGFKMLGVKPQTDDDKLAACDALAAYLTS